MDNFNKNDDLYDPNFSIHSDNTGKLDMYGVWLKKKKDVMEPLDLGDSESTSDSDPGTDQDNINFDEGFSFSDSFSDMAADTEIPELDELSDDTDTSAEVPLEMPAPSYADRDSPDVALDEDSFESLDLDDFLSDDTPIETKHQETSETFVEEDPIALDFTEITDNTTQTSNRDEAPAGLENFSEISLEDFEDADPAETSRSDDDFETVDDFDDIFTDDAAGEQKAKNSEQKKGAVLDINVTADDEGSKVQPLSELSSQVVEDNVDIPIFGTDDDTEESAFFDDIEAVKEDLLSTQQVAELEEEPIESASEKDTKETMNTTAIPFQRSTAEHDKATELLMQIAHEISDLKAELNSLKADMAAQSKVISEAPIKDSGNGQDDKSADTESSGFFSDDDTDETIALTGDELNNILITADFTEERNAEDGDRAVIDEETAENYEVPPVLTKDIDPEMQETPAADHSFEDSIAELSSAEEVNDYKPEAEGEKLLATEPVFNVEPTPITSLPEDLSYLDDQSEVTDETMDLIDGDVGDQQEVAELEELETLESADDENDFESINIESFDIPSEQEIEVPTPNTEPVEEKIQSAAEVTAARTIHELENDEDFPNPFADDASNAPLEAEITEEIIKEPLIGEVPDIEPEFEESTGTKPLEEFDAIPELEPEEENVSDVPKQETLLQAATKKREATVSIPLELKNEIKSVLSYMDQLLEALPEKKIEEFAKSEYFETYKHLFEELGIS